MEENQQRKAQRALDMNENVTREGFASGFEQPRQTDQQLNVVRHSLEKKKAAQKQQKQQQFVS